ncbi:MAG: hypothetical protein MJB57_16785, partial [Gemmatimonadetes bacterium]|nr:hypothetical protein [Gemmatimonadota bacterium]
TDRIVEAIDATRDYVAGVIAAKSTSEADFEAFMLPLRPLIRENFAVGAREQLDQFRAQMDAWKTEFPTEDWAALRVVVLGFHQPRDEYALKLFFQWLLEEPAYEKRVVFAEFQHSIFGPDRAEAVRLALELLTKVDLDAGAAEIMFGDEAMLGRDVMGPAAGSIIRAWGQPTWP